MAAGRMEWPAGGMFLVRIFLPGECEGCGGRTSLLCVSIEKLDTSFSK